MQILQPPTCQKTTSCLVTRGTKLNQSHADTATLQRCLQEQSGSRSASAAGWRLGSSRLPGSTAPTGVWKSTWSSKASIGPGEPKTASGLRGSLVSAKWHAECNPQGPPASAEQHQPGQGPFPTSTASPCWRWEPGPQPHSLLQC